MIKKCGLVVVVLLTLSYSCKYPFEAELAHGNSGILVVDGYIDVGPAAVTTITLSRSTPLNEEAQFIAEQGAGVSIEDEDNNSFSLVEISPGRYQSSTLNLLQTKSYRLKILSQGKVYVSEFIEPIVTPGIDSITWKQTDGGVEINVSTHDPENNTKYYQWNYDEVWERTAPYYSYFKVEGGKLKPRSAPEISELKTCWVYRTGADLNIESSEKYPSDVIPKNPVLFIPKFDERLFVRYSISVRQHALSREAFTFYEAMKKNGSLGTFSDSMPSELPGNLSCLESTEPVVGYIGVYTTRTQRIEIWESELTEDWITPPYCEEEKMTIQTFESKSGRYTPTTAALEIGSPDTLTWAVQTPCADCRFDGGTNLKPSFWD